MADALHPIWQKHPGLVWSNPAAGDATRIRAALLHPRFQQLLEITLAFGLDRVRSEWAVLEEEADPETLRVREAVERILNNIEKGFAIAASQH